MRKPRHFGRGRPLAMMEAGDPTVSIDLLLRSLFSLGASPKQLARVLASVTLS